MLLVAVQEAINCQESYWLVACLKMLFCRHRLQALSFGIPILIEDYAEACSKLDFILWSLS